MQDIYDIFISYDRRDGPLAKRLAELLTNSGKHVFFDIWRIAPGEEWIPRLEDALSTCRSVIVLAGANGLSGWQKREVSLALERQSRDDSLAVFPVLLPGAEDLALGFLTLNTWVKLEDGLDDDEIIAALTAGLSGYSPAIDTAPSPREDVCPYRGLEPFREEDAPFFYGRDAFASRLEKLVKARNFVVVVGASGSGKSSIVEAGLCPILRRGADGPAWDIVSMRPGSSPLRALLRALDPPGEEEGIADAHDRLRLTLEALQERTLSLLDLVEERLARSPGLDQMLIVVDQFEEAATLTANPDERGRFIDALLELVAATPAIRIVATLRSDFYTEIVSRRDMIEQLDGAVLNVGPLAREATGDSPSELEQAIRRPAEAVGLSFADGLVDRIIADVGEAPGDLPLLEYLLTELWRRRESGVLTHGAYDAIGGVRGAIATRAEDAFSALSAPEKAAARRVFLSLIRPGEGARDTRARAAFPEDDIAASVVNQFAGRRLRLLVSGRDDAGERTVDLGHEALIDGWARLGEWIDHSRSHLRILNRLRTRRLRWVERDRVGDLLLPSGLELEEARNLLAAGEDIAVGEVRDYIDASIAAEVARIEDARRRANAEAEMRSATKRRQRRIFAGAAIVSLIFITAAAWQWRVGEFQREAAEAERAAAAEKTRLADARSVADIARRTLDSNPGETSVAAMTAAASLRLSPNFDATNVLRDALALAPRGAELAETPWRHAQGVVSANGRVAAYLEGSGSSDRDAMRATIVELDRDLNQRRRHEFEGLVEPVFSADGRWLTASGHDRRLVVIDRTTGERVVDRPTRGGVFPAFSASGETLYAATQTGEVLRYDIENWSARPALTYPIEGASSDPAYLAAGANERLLVLSGDRAVHDVSGKDGAAARLSMDFTPDADSPTRRVPAEVRALDKSQRGLVFDNRGRGVIWEFATSDIAATLDDKSGVWSSSDAIVWDADERLLVRAAYRGAVTVWSLATYDIIARFDYGAPTYAAAFSETGERIIVAGEDGATIWQAVSGARIGECGIEEVASGVVVAPSGDILLAGNAGGLYRCPSDGGAAVEVTRFDRPIRYMTAAPDGGVALTLSAERMRDNWSEISFVDQASGREISRVLWNGGLSDVVLSPDGSLAAAREFFTKKIHIWRTSTGERVKEIATKDQLIGFGPAGKRLRFDGLAIWTMDIATGERSAEMGEPGGVSDLHVEPDTGVIVTRGAAEDGGDEHRGWNPATGEELWRHPYRGEYVPHAGAVVRVVEVEDGAEMRLLDFESGRLIGAAQTETSFLTYRYLSPSRDRIAFVEMRRNEFDQQLPVPRILDLKTGRDLLPQIDEDMIRPPGFVRISHDVIGVLAVFVKQGKQQTMLHAIRWADGAELWRRSLSPSSFTQHVAANEAGTKVILSLDFGVLLIDAATGETIWDLPEKGFIAAGFSEADEVIVLNDVIDSDSHSLVFVEGKTGAVRSEARLESSVREFEMTSDGSRVLVALEADNRYAIEAWRLSDGARDYRVLMDIGVHTIAPLKDPKRFVALDFSGGVRLFDMRSDEAEARFRFAHATNAGAGHFAKTASRAVTKSGASIRYWDSESGAERAKYRADGDVGSIAIRPDGEEVAFLSQAEEEASSGAVFRTLTFWRPGSDEQAISIPVGKVQRIQYDPTGRVLALAAADKKSVRFVDRETLLTTLVIEPLGDEDLDLANSTPLIFTADGRFVVVTSGKNYGQGNANARRKGARVFDLAEGREVMRFDLHPYRSLAPAGDGFFYSGPDERLRKATLPIPPLDPFVTHKASDRLFIHPEGERLLLTDFLEADRLIDLETGVDLAFTDADHNTTADDLSADGALIAMCRQSENTGGLPAIIEIYDGRSGKRIASAEDPSIRCRRIRFIGNGDVVVYGDNVAPRKNNITFSQDLRLWSWRDGAMTTLIGDNPVAHVAISGDGARMVTVEGDKDSDGRVFGTPQVRVWDVATLQPIFTLSDVDTLADITDIGTHVELSENGRLLALFDHLSPTEGEVIDLDAPGGPARRLSIAREDRAFWGQPLGFIQDDRFFVIGVGSGARIFDLETGDERRLREADRVRRFSLSDDGAHIALGTDDQVSVWDVARGEKLFETKVEDLWRMAFMPARDGRLLIRQRRSVHLLEWRGDRLIEEACQVFAKDRWDRGFERLLGAEAASPCQ